jgi:hypothetical protein
MDGAVHTSSSAKFCIGGIDYGVGLFACDVSALDFETRRSDE